MIYKKRRATEQQQLFEDRMLIPQSASFALLKKTQPACLSLPAKPTSTQLADLVLEGDAFDLFLTLPRASIDLIITSPPYWGHREYGLGHNWDLFNDIARVREIGTVSPGYDWYRKRGGLLGLEPYPEWYVTHLAEIFSRAFDALKPDGNLWVNIGDTYFARWSSIRELGRQGLRNDERYRRKTPMGGVRQEKQLLLIPSRFAIAMQEYGWILRNDLIWYKPNATPRPEGDRLKLAHEHFFHMVKKPKEGRASYFYRPEYAESRLNDVVIVNVAPGEKGHTATFPRALIEPRILTSSPDGGTVLDPFCGTGRALEVAKRLGRSVVGFDAQQKFVEVTQNKLRIPMRMSKRGSKPPHEGNYVSEWFGQRIYPMVRLNVTGVTGSRYGQCPFLTNVLNGVTDCVKSENSAGVCTISSTSNGPRQDWIVCPYRVFDSDIVRCACAMVFGLQTEVLPLPVPVLKRVGELDKFKAVVRKNGAGYLFFQDKLGGEISVIATKQSPELAFDVTLVEVVYVDGMFQVSRYGILEIQTMDFHGSYKHAVKDLRDALRLHEKDFPQALQDRQEWAGKRVEGPNIANVFKRTFYQIMLKFKLSAQGGAAGTVLALPTSVWESWQPFLGAPQFEDESDGIKRIRIAHRQVLPPLNAFICVFDLDSHHRSPISPVVINHFIRVSPEQLAHLAFSEVPNHILDAIKDSDMILSRIRMRMAEWWPDLKGVPIAKKKPRKTRE